MQDKKTNVEQYTDEKFGQAYWLTILNRGIRNGDLFKDVAIMAFVGAILVTGLFHLPELSETFRNVITLMAN